MIICRRFWFAACVFVFLLIISAIPQAIASGSLRTVALHGDTVGSTGLTIIQVQPRAVINNLGEVAFRADFDGSTREFGYRGLLAAAPAGPLTVVARGGDLRPDIGEGVVISSIASRWFVINNRSEVLFHSRLAGDNIDSSNDLGLFVGRPSQNPVLIARDGDLAPNSGEGRFTELQNRAPAIGFGDAVLNDAGTVSFWSQLEEPDGEPPFGLFDGESGVYIRPSGSDLDAILRTQSTLAGESDDFAVSRLLTPVLNNNGKSAFAGGLSSDSERQSVIFVNDPVDGLSILARTGDPAPVPNVDSAYTSIYRDPTINDRGQVAFTAELTNVVVGVFRTDEDGETEMVTRYGAPAPDSVDGEFSYMSPPVINQQGKTAFQALVTEPGDGSPGSETSVFGIYSEGVSRGLHAVARQGDLAPGTDDETVFSRFFPRRTRSNLLNFEESPAMNARGQTAFTAVLSGPNVERAVNDRGIFAEDVDGVLQLIARTGDQLDVSDDPAMPDLRTIVDLDLVTGNGNEDSRPSAFNDRGQLVFQAIFTDRTTGIFVSDQVAIPEPTTLVLILSAMTAAACRRTKV